MTFPLTTFETLKRFSRLPILKQNHSGGDFAVLGIVPHLVGSLPQPVSTPLEITKQIYDRYGDFLWLKLYAKGEH